MVELGEHGVVPPAIEDSIHFSVVYLYANRAISFLGQLFSINSKDWVCEFGKRPLPLILLVVPPAIEDSIHFSVVYLYANRAISFLGQLFSINSKDWVCEFGKRPLPLILLNY